MQKQEITVYDHFNHPVFFQAESGAAVTTSDSTVLAPGILFVGTTGDVKVRTRLGSDLTFSNLANATFLPVIVDMVYSTGTTASDILILR